MDCDSSRKLILIADDDTGDSVWRISAASP
jgi:hypothetical protein